MSALVKPLAPMKLAAGALALACGVAGPAVQAQPTAVPNPYTLKGSALLGGSGGYEADAPGLAPGSQGLDGVVDLSRAWRLALQFDHTYQAAISEQAATATELAQGRAGLLPQIQAGYSRSRVTGTVGQPNIRGQRVTSEVRYDSTNAYVQLQQPLLNYGRYANYRRGVAKADEGVAVFAAKEQDAGVRLVAAYLNALLAYDHLGLQRSLVASLEELAKGLEARFARNEGTQTDVQVTKARLAVARADAISFNDQLQVALRELEAVLGAAPQRLAALKPNFPALPLQPASQQAWLDRARVNNAQVRAAREAVNVAEAEVDRANSRYFPTMDLVASYGKADSENLSTLSQRTNTFVIGVQVNIPIFTGGYNTANVSRARLDLRRVQHELDAALARTDAEVTRQYTNVVGGAERIHALEAAVESGELTLMSAQRSFEAGIFSNLDVLRSQDKLYEAKYQLVKARLEYLMARLRLAAAAGDLRVGEIDGVNDAYLGRVITPEAAIKP